MRRLVLFLSLLAVSCSGSQEVATVDGPSGTIVVANMAANTVMLIDAANGQLLQTIPSGPAPHEVALSGDGRRAVITNYGDRSTTGNSLTVIDITGEVEPETIDLGIYERPHGIVFLPGSDMVAVTSEATESVVFVDVSTGEIHEAVPTKQKVSHMVARDASGARLFTTNIVAGSITEIDGSGRKHKKVITVGPMVEGLVASESGDRVWVGANREQTVMAVNTATGEIEATLEGFGFPYRMALVPGGGHLLISDPQNGEVRIVDSETSEEVTRVTFPREGVLPTAEFPGSPAPEGIVIEQTGRYAFVSLQGLNKVAAIKIDDGSIYGYYAAGEWPDGIGVSHYTIQN